jgi:predicted ArsR family transcriptional regulator
MKKYIAVALLAAVSVFAAEKGEKKHGPVLTDEQKAIIAKYDTNKDGKLDKDERAKMTDEDKAKLPPPPDRKKKA